MLRDLYTIKEIAEQMGVTEKSVRKLISKGDLKASKICEKWIVTAENLKKLVKKKEYHSPNEIYK